MICLHQHSALHAGAGSHQSFHPRSHRSAPCLVQLGEEERQLPSEHNSRITTVLPSNLQVSWEPEIAEKIRQLQRSKQLQQKVRAACGVPTTNAPLMVGVVGIPGSGKSTSCEMVATMLNADNQGTKDDTLVLPMDGYHTPLQQLAQEFPEPNELAKAIYRRGAPDTFQPASLERDLQRIREGQQGFVSIPGFDHARGDPVPGQHAFVRDQHDIIIVEGIYLMHDEDGWGNVKNYFDYMIYIVADVDTCIERLKKRNQCLPGYASREEIELRCERVDRANAMTVERSSQYANEHVLSVTAKEVPRAIDR
mmetsp:Transcript_21316/g.46253  ORF Transcript_21316/g.46253 Transcript_21316/m.46253 type:complete len:309 (-) Transcript_21316:344-1270(-)